MPLTTAMSQPREQTGSWSRLTGWLAANKKKTLTDWTVEQLTIQPYQHILEIGHGTGYTLSEVARQLKIGFLAGMDESIDMYRIAYAKNKKLIAEDLMELHIGGIQDIAYPRHYFHTIYGTNTHLDWKSPSLAFRKLASHLRTNGKLVMVFQPAWASTDQDIKQAADKMKNEFWEAGLIKVQVEYRDLHPVTAISVTGYK
jgi:cyclopropane fatty-acyl-phospholipid synthase-like methyltransferase